MSTETKIMETISEALNAWGFTEQEEPTAEQREFYKVLWAAFDLLARTKLISSMVIPMPEDIKEPGDPEMISRYPVTASPEMERIFHKITTTHETI